MQTTADALAGWSQDEYGSYIEIGDVEIRIEKLLFDGQFYLAIYENEQLVAPKVVFKAGKE